MSDRDRVGLIGVGYIGKEFVERVREAGHPLTVFDIDAEQVAFATERGATAADSPAAVARTADVVVTALPGTPEVEATMEGPDGLLSELGAGQLVVDASTTRPETSIACESACTDAGAAFLEAPITGGAPREGYQMMVGGDADRYREATPILDVLCADHARVGPVPEGTVLKLGLQMRYAGHRAIDAEVVEFVRDRGVDPRLFVDFLGFDVWERYFTGDFEQAIEGLGGLDIWHKDLGYALAVADEHDIALPLTAAVHEAYKATARRVAADEGHAAAIVKYWQALNDAAPPET